MTDKPEYEWLQTYTGVCFPFSFDDPGRINIQDIAHSLALQCRFNGHCKEFYSVAQHSVWVSNMVTDPELKIPALLHDASEAYLGDMIYPLKHSGMFDKFKECEKLVDLLIAQHFGFDVTLLHHPDIRHADAVMLATERDQFMSKPPRPWQDLPDPLRIRLVCAGPKDAEAMFMEEWNYLTRGWERTRAS